MDFYLIVYFILFLMGIAVRILTQSNPPPCSMNEHLRQQLEVEETPGHLHFSVLPKSQGATLTNTPRIFNISESMPDFKNQMLCGTRVM